MPELGVGYMPKPFQQPRPPIFISLGEPEFVDGAASRRERGWGMISANIIPTYVGRLALDQSTATPAAPNGMPAARRQLAGRAQHRWWRRSDARGARARVRRPQASNRYFFTYMREVLSRVGLLVILKPRPDMPDDEATPRGDH